MAARFGVAPGELAAGERVALIGVVLQTWHALQQDANAREAAWQRERANELRAVSAAAAASAAATKARNAAAAAAEARLRRFRAALGDGLPFGVAVMLGAFAAGAMRLGLLAPLLRRCRPLATLGPLTPRRPWALLEAAGVAACWAGAAGDLAAAAMGLLAGGWLVARAGLLAGEPHSRPLVRIVLGLGCGAGAAGYCAVARVGGDARAWLAAWEAWLCLHVLAAWAAPAALGAAAPLDGKASCALGAAGMAAYHAVMALVLPAMVGVAPFRGRLSPLELLAHGLRCWLWA
ncbi:hypothetical protein WJX81_002255 [Elliptochloris bilobata]|uniref:Uncharacterized protein n=1 Tax=Elliptochloris bilobata TaxID=381761 RepID=A0AAW1QDC1_9CHLO